MIGLEIVAAVAPPPSAAASGSPLSLMFSRYARSDGIKVVPILLFATGERPEPCPLLFLFFFDGLASNGEQ